MMSKSASRLQRVAQLLGDGTLFLITSLSAIAVLFIFFFIARDAIPFFRLGPQGGFNFEMFKQFFGTTAWYPSQDPASFGGLAIFFGTGVVTCGAVVVAMPLGIAAAVCLSDVLPFGLRQVVKPVIEILAAIPSVAYGFFALVVFAPLLQERGGTLLSVAWWVVCAPLLGLSVVVGADVLADRLSTRLPERGLGITRTALLALFGGIALGALYLVGVKLAAIEVQSGTNALNVSILLGIMALPTVVSVSEDALQAVGRELREGSYALGATRAETVVKTVIPAALSGICAAVILGVMRAVGETMVVWMASGNAAQVPQPWYNVLAPVRTLTATIAGDMGEADHVTGSYRYHVLFAMALCLLTFSFGMNLASEWIVRRSRRKTGR